MGIGKFLKKNAGALSQLSQTLGGSYGQLASSGFGVLDAREQEKAALKSAQRSRSALEDEQRRRDLALQGLGGQPRSSPVSLFSEEGELGSMLPKGVSPLILVGGVAAVLLLYRR